MAESKAVPISGEMMKFMALKVAENMGIERFHAYNG